jgi:hypothetical protein
MKTETEQKTRKTIIYLIMIIIIMRGENFVAHLDGLGGTPVAHHWHVLNRVVQNKLLF